MKNKLKRLNELEQIKENFQTFKSEPIHYKLLLRDLKKSKSPTKITIKKISIFEKIKLFFCKLFVYLLFLNLLFFQ